MDTTDEPGTVGVSVRNLGGIDSLELAFDPGVTVLTGRNATNRTSLVRSIATALGGSAAELKRDADAGEVALDVGDARYARRFERADGTVRVSGEPYADEGDLVDAFACLLETNPARQAVVRAEGARLREVVMAPVDTAAISARIDEASRELHSVADRIDEIGRRRDNLPALEQQRAERREELADLESELASVRNAVDEVEADADTAEAAEEVVEELKAVRDEYETVRDRLETQRDAVASLEDERETVRAQFEDATAPGEELATAREELERLQRRERELATTVNSLLSIVEFNQELLEGSTDLPVAGGNGPLDQLDPTSREVECWTCGTSVERGDVADRLDDLRGVVDEKREERRGLRDRLDDRRATVADLEERADERAALESKLSAIDEELADREARIEELEAEAGTLQDRIEELEAEATAAEELRDSELLDRYQRLSELEYERGRVEERVESLEEEIAAIEALAAEREGLRERRDDLDAELAELRGRIETLERSAVDTFNEHMATLLERLEYENVERVWIERKVHGDGDGTAPESTFDLHVVRSTADGSVFEDTVDHLSESERELIGLVVALAGYLVHDVHETVPVMLLDSLEAIDADRIATLVEYFADYPTYLVVALLPEDAQALPDRYERVHMGGAVA
jgi:DNA repair ATPase RecN